jgi:hypothetical protein
MQRTIVNHWILLILGFSIAGCVPARLTIEPRASFLVTDSAGAPLDGVQIELATTRGPFGPRTVTTYLTGDDGRLEIKKKAEWHLWVLLPDGTAWYEWKYCAQKQGYVAYAPETAEFSQPILIVLAESNISLTCEWPTHSPFYPAEVVGQDP